MRATSSIRKTALGVGIVLVAVLASTGVVATSSVRRAEATGPSLQIGSGTTAAGVGWRAYGTTGITIVVDTSSAQFSHTPTYVTSLGGSSAQWQTTGGSSVYYPTRTSFQVFVRFYDGRVLTPEYAASVGWRINWIGSVD
jgi:hypothetical protein